MSALIFGTPEANALAEPHLEPCPFCGESSELTIGGGRDAGYHQHFYVECPFCGCRGPWTFDERETVREWNKRWQPEARP